MPSVPGLASKISAKRLPSGSCIRFSNAAITSAITIALARVFSTRWKSPAPNACALRPDAPVWRKLKDENSSETITAPSVTAAR